MFNKFKKKIESDLKPLPMLLSSSVQQIAQVISPSPSVNSLSNSKLSDSASATQDASNVSADFFSICDEQDVEELRQLQTVDLSGDFPNVLTSRSRRDSLSSIASDVSSLFPIYESPLNHSSLQNDLESEIDESTSTQLDKISKEKLYQGYRKLLQRYNKYKGRFLEVSRVHKDLQYENMKMKNVLQDSQDKALRRIAELREQCQLEQKAKAHLEESLRNDLEEKEHYITTLNTKIELLKKGPLNSENSMISTEIIKESENLDDLITKNNELTSEVSRLKLLLDETSSLSNGPPKESTGQLKEKITQLKSGIVRMKSENENISNLLSKSPNASDAGDDSASLIDFNSDTDEKDRKIEKLSELLLKCKEKIKSYNTEMNKKSAIISDLNDKVQKLNSEVSSAKAMEDKVNKEIKEMKLVEEENVITIAENKKAIHAELEAKERQIKELSSELEHSRASQTKMKEMADIKWAHYEKIIKEYKDEVTEAVQSKNQLLNKLKNESEGKSDTRSIENEKEILNSIFKSLMKNHQDKLNAVFNLVDNKITKAESNLARLCADKLINFRNSEMELKQKITRLEDQAQNTTHAVAQSADLEEKIKTLEMLIYQKDAIIEEKSAEINKLNAELSENIDRIFALGTQIEDNNEKHKLIEESLETKYKNITKLKADGDKEYDEISEKSMKQATELKELHKINSKIHNENEILLNTNKEHLKSIAQLEKCFNETNEANTKLKLEVSKLEDLLCDSKALVEGKEKELYQLQTNLDESSTNKIEMNEICDKIKLLEDELILAKKEKIEIKEEKNRIVKEYSEKLLELENKIETLERKDLNNQTLVEDRNKDLQESNKCINEKNLEIEKINNLLLEKEKDANEKIFRISKDIEIKSCKLEENSKKIILLEEQLNKNIENFNELECNHKEAIHKLIVEHEKTVDNLKKNADSNKEKYDREISELKIQLSQLAEESNNANTDLVKLKEENASKIVDLEKLVEQLQNELGTKVNELKVLTEKLEVTEDAKHEEEERRSELENTVKDLNKLIEAKTDESDSFNKEIQELKKKLHQLQEECDKATSDMANTNKINNDHALTVTELGKIVEDLQNKIKSKDSDIKNLTDKINISDSLNIEKNMKSNDLVDKIKELEELLDVKTKEIDNIRKDCILKEAASRDACSDLENRIKLLTEEYDVKSSQLSNELSVAKNKLIELKNSADNETAKIKEESESKLNILKNEIKFINEKYENEVGNIENNRNREAAELIEKLDHSEKMSAELLKKLEAVSAEKDDLLQGSDEKSLKLIELESCLSTLKSDLDKNFNETSKISSQHFEETYEQKLRQLEKDYETKISIKDDLIRDAELFKSENAEVLESVKSLRNDIKNLRNELKEKDNAIELKIEELELLRNETENKIANSKIDNEGLIEKEILKYEERLKSQKDEFDKQMKLEKEEYEKLIEDEKLKAIHSIENEKCVFDKALKEIEVERSKEKEGWLTQKKNIDELQTNLPSLPEFETIELERTSKVAVAAVGSNTESMDALRKEIMKQAEEIKEIKKQHKREVLELGKLAALRARSFSEREGEDVEHEYLRNILYEYMMGREQMVLAKVLAAIVKFDQQQTHNILERQASVGALRIL